MKRWPARTVERWIWAGAAALTLGGAVFASLASYNGYQAVVTELRESIDRTAMATAGFVTASLEGIDLRLGAAADGFADWRAEPAPTAESGYEILSRIAAGSHYIEGIGWMDAAGNLVASSVAPTRPPLNVAEQPHFKAQRDDPHRGLFIGAPFASSQVNKRISTLSRRLDGPAGEFLGIVTGFTDLNALTADLAKVIGHGAVELTIAIDGGQPWLAIPSTLPISPQSAWTRQVAIGNGLTVLVRGSPDHLLEPWLETRTLAVLLVLLLAATSCGAAWSLSRVLRGWRANIDALARSEARLANAQRVAGIGSWDWTPASDEAVWTEEIYRILGLDPSSVPARHALLLDRLHPLDRPAVETAMRAAFETGVPQSLDHRVVRPDGAVRFVHQHVVVVHSSGSAPSRVTGVMQDVSDMRAAEAARQQTEARLAAILTIAPEAIIAAAEDGTIELFNTGAERIFGYKAEDILGRSIEVLMPQRLRQRHGGQVSDFGSSPISQRLMTQRGRVTGLRQDGSEFPADASIAKLELEGRRLYTVMLADVTDRVAAEKALIAARDEAETGNRTKSEFLANMSHELRTPLNAIIGFSELMGQEPWGPLGDPRYAAYAKDILASGQHLLDIINDILDVSRIEAGREELAEADTDLAALVAECLPMFEPQAARQGVTLRLNASPGMPTYRVDQRKIKQIVINLLSNAVKFSPAGGTVEIAVAPCDGAATVRVADTGVGIAPTVLPRLFQPFAQGEAGLNRRFEGSGLGLALSRSLARLHGGDIVLTSAPGAGTTVTLTLPAERQAEAGPAAAA